jgi:hypothetical protein
MKRVLVTVFLLLTAIFSAKAANWRNVGSNGFSAGQVNWTSIAIDSSGTPYVAYEDVANSNKATVMKFNDTIWVTLGNAGFSAGTANNPSIVIDKNGTPYIAFADGANSNKATVMKYNGTNWVTVGIAGFSNTQISDISMVLDSSGTPIVVFRDFTDNALKATCMKYNGTNWVTVGNAGFTPGRADIPSISIDGNGTLYVFFSDEVNSYKARVMKFNGTNWVTVGNTGFSAGTFWNSTISLDRNDTPYVAYQDAGNNGKATVMKFNGTNWVTVGNAGFSNGYSDYLKLKIDSSGTPIVAYMDGSANYKATVMKYNGTNWIAVGNAGLSIGEAFFTSFALDSKSIPYIVYCDVSKNYKATVKKYDESTSWKNVGTAGFSSGDSWLTSIAIDKNNTPFVVYSFGQNSYKASVMKYNSNNWVTVGNDGFSAGRAWYISLAIDGNGFPYVVYSDDSNSEKATVMKYNGTNWVTVGNAGFSPGTAWNTSIVIDGNDTPYVAYTDGANSYKATVMKFNGTNWVTVGNAGFSEGSPPYKSLAIDRNGTLYVVYTDDNNNDKATVKKFDGANWVAVGNSCFTAGKAGEPAIVIDGNGTPYVLFGDFVNSYKLTVMKFNGNNWVTVGNAGFSSNSTPRSSIAIDSSGTPYVFFQDRDNLDRATVMKYNGTKWILVGNEGFSSKDLESLISIAINKNGTPYVVFMDKGNNFKATVMNYPGVTPSIFTTSISNISINSASSGGHVTEEGSSNVTSRGVCWSTSQNPTTSDSKTTDGSGTGIFLRSITGLSPNTKYYIRAYATNSVGTAYGDQITFKTKITPPTLTSPSNNASNVSILPTLTWNSVNGISNYLVQVSLNHDFSSFVFNNTTTSVSQALSGLGTNTEFFWRVCAVSGTDLSDWTEVWKFETVLSEPIPATWTYASPTGNNATVGVLANINPKIGDRDFKNGDAIGFFFKRNDSLKCAGYKKWTGNNIAITVWGDDDRTLEKDGFILNEAYNLKIWDAQTGKEYDAEVTYDLGESYYTKNGLSRISLLKAIITETQSINFTLGWNMISAYILTDKPLMDSIWKNLIEDIAILKNNSGDVYIPEWNINDIGNWDVTQGYQAYLYSAKTLPITGIPVKPESNPLILSTGWGLISYLRNSSISTPTALQTIVDGNSLIIAKNNFGEVYIPVWDIDDIGNLVPGQGYQVYLSKADTLIYPVNSLGRSAAKEHRPVPKYLIPEVSMTGNNSVLLLKCENIENMNEIGVYANSNQLVGSGVVFNGVAVITIWGDDSQTPEIDGALNSYELKVMSYELKTGKITDVNLSGLIDFITNEQVSEMKYSKDGVYYAKAEVKDNSAISLNIKPNPANDIIEIEFSSPDCNNTEISIYSSNGKLIDKITDKLQTLSGNIISYNVSKLSSGEYTFTMTCGNEKAMRKVVVVR